MTGQEAINCECGHPKAAHRWKQGYLHGQRVMDQPCVATVTRRHDHGDDCWPCPCTNFRAVSA